MTSAEQMWQAFLQDNPSINQEMDAWSFGVEADALADLVLKGTKTATASVYDLYDIDKVPLPQENTYDVILDSKEEAVCVVKVTSVKILPFNQVTEEHAYKEGEGDRSLAYWRDVHETLFSQWLAEADLTFNPDSKVVLEEFEVVYS